MKKFSEKTETISRGQNINFKIKLYGKHRQFMR